MRTICQEFDASFSQKGTHADHWIVRSLFALVGSWNISHRDHWSRNLLRNSTMGSRNKKIPQNVDISLEKVKPVDELSAFIDRNPKLYTLYRYWFWLTIALFVFALAFLLVGIVGSLAFDHKSHLAAGLSIFQLIGCPLGYAGHILRIRYLIFACHYLNIIWLASSLILITVNVFTGKFGV